ncbi:unnamed protein product [Larinioides sclopetarius]|uniref:Sperm microtubule inner protein 1 C-terminal domain-containing protein n=1 Tax=Larinioides sclopetarius TaxID=280406 RepID=A0AAV2A2A5_9ARAC
MKIPPPIVKSKLYEGISHDGKGRAEYLRTRWKEDPENKFHNRVCSSWNYGWNHGKKNEFSCKDPDHCKIRKQAFYQP